MNVRDLRFVSGLLKLCGRRVRVREFTARLHRVFWCKRAGQCVEGGGSIRGVGVRPVAVTTVCRIRIQFRVPRVNEGREEDRWVLRRASVFGCEIVAGLAGVPGARTCVNGGAVLVSGS